MNWTTYNNAGAALSQSLTDMPVGTITGYAGTTAPSGWLLCDGSAVSRTTYAELFGVVSTTYGSGDGSTTFNVPDSSGFIILASSQAARLAAAALPQYVTSLPSSPVDGQTVVYAADATNGVMWTLRYRAASSSSYKWEFVGGGSFISRVTASVTATSPTPAAKTGGPSFTLPFAGTYRIGYGALAAAGTDYAAIVPYYNGTTLPGYASDAAEAAHHASTKYIAIASELSDTVTTASQTLELYYKSDAGTATFIRRWMRVTPVRVG